MLICALLLNSNPKIPIYIYKCNCFSSIKVYIYVYVCNYVCAFLNICVRVRSLEVKFKDCQLNKIRSNNWKLRIDELRANQESAWHVVLIVASECDVVRPPSGLRTKVKSNKIDNHNIIRTSKLIASNAKKKK